MHTRSEFKNILLDMDAVADSAVAVITLNRPEVLNAMSRELVSELSNALVALESEPQVRAVVITGAGTRAFSAGGDIHEMAASSAEELAAGRELITRFGWYLANYKLPTIGAMNGLAYGGGAFLAAALDMRIGCERTRFRFLGAQYGRLNSTWSLPLIIGWARAKELLYSARIVEAEEAARMDLLNHLVPAAQVMDKSMELARQIAKNPADQVQGAKQLLHQYVGDAWQGMFDAEYEATRTRLKPSPVSEAFAGFLGSKGR